MDWHGVRSRYADMSGMSIDLTIDPSPRARSRTPHASGTLTAEAIAAAQLSVTAQMEATPPAQAAKKQRTDVPTTPTSGPSAAEEDTQQRSVYAGPPPPQRTSQLEALINRAGQSREEHPTSGASASSSFAPHPRDQWQGRGVSWHGQHDRSQSSGQWQGGTWRSQSTSSWQHGQGWRGQSRGSRWDRR